MIDGSGPPTIYSVAAEAGVSIATVSRVLRGTATVSEATRRKVEDAAQRLAYVPLASARSLASSRAEAVGLVLPRLTGPYYSELLRGFAEVAAELGQSVVLHLESARGAKAADLRDLAGRVDGIAFLAHGAAGDDLVATARRRRPVVTVAREPAEGADAFLAENTRSAVRLASHLLQHGRRALGFLGDPDSSPDVRGRYAGFAEALEAAGLPVPKALAVRQDEVSVLDYLADHLDDVTAYEAVMCANDEVALATIRRLREAGRGVPDDLAVVGWDDVVTGAYLTPGLTTVAQPVVELGRSAARRLHERIGGAAPADEPTVLPTHVVFRQSCGCP